MIIGIDTGNNMNYTGIVGGSEYDIFQLYSEIENFMKNEGIKPPLRWTSIKSSKRKLIKERLQQLFNESRVKFTIIIHKNKYGLPIRELIYETIPMIVSKSLEKWFRGISGKILFEVDNDFNSRDTKTKYFIHKIFTYTASLLSDELIKIREKSGVHMMTLRHKPGIIMFVGRISDSKVSKAIQIVDLFIGCFKYGINLSYEKMFIKKLC
jgi:hypothetical protein